MSRLKNSQKKRENSYFCLITEFEFLQIILRTSQATKVFGKQCLLIHELLHAPFSINNSIAWIGLTNTVTETKKKFKAIDHCIYIYKSHKQTCISPLLGLK